jgi:hypothetical protein
LFYDMEQSGQIVGPRIDLKFNDDINAIAHCEQLITGKRLEVWEGTRLVVTLPRTFIQQRLESGGQF